MGLPTSRLVAQLCGGSVTCRHVVPLTIGLMQPWVTPYRRARPLIEAPRPKRFLIRLTASSVSLALGFSVPFLNSLPMSPLPLDTTRRISAISGEPYRTPGFSGSGDPWCRHASPRMIRLAILRLIPHLAAMRRRGTPLPASSRRSCTTCSVSFAFPFLLPWTWGAGWPRRRDDARMVPLLRVRSDQDEILLLHRVQPGLR